MILMFLNVELNYHKGLKLEMQLHLKGELPLEVSELFYAAIYILFISTYALQKIM